MGILKELIAEVKRWKNDKKANEIRYLRMAKKDRSTFESVRSAELKVGDILELKDGDIIPADCLLLHSPNEHGESYIQTASLDGERNLKLKVCPKYI